MSEHGSGGDDKVSLVMSGKPKRNSSEENGTKTNIARPMHISHAWVVCFGIDDSTICEQAFNCTY